MRTYREALQAYKLETTNSGTEFSTRETVINSNNGKQSFDYEQGGAQISRNNKKIDGGELGTAGDATFSYLSDTQAGDGYHQLSTEQMATTNKAMDILSSVANITFKAADGGTGNNIPDQGKVEFMGYDANFGDRMFVGPMDPMPFGGGRDGGDTNEITEADGDTGGNISDQGEIKFMSYDGSGGGRTVSELRDGEATTKIMESFIAISGSRLSNALHEIGHAIGLSHPGEYNIGSFNYNSMAEFFQDSKQYSVMSYFSGENTGAVLSRFAMDENAQGVHMGGATGLGLYDIAALQRLYGANETTYATDTTYGFNSNTDDDGWTLNGKTDWIQAAIWDAGGNDTIDMSGYAKNAEIDLREESFSSTGGLTYNLAIAKGAVIENAIGGTGNDILQGNAVNNQLTGGEGNDTLNGGGGSDTAEFVGNFAEYLFTLVSEGVYAISDTLDRDGTDTVSGIESFTFADGTKSEAEIKAAITDPINLPAYRVDSPVEPADSPVEPVYSLVYQFGSLVEPVGSNETNDTMIYQPGNLTVMHGGEGSDTADFSQAIGSVYVNLGYACGPEAWGASSSEVRTAELKVIADLVSIENVTGSQYDDFLAGNLEDNVLTGGSGNDIFGFFDDFGNDTIDDFNDGDDWISLINIDGLNTFDQLDIKQEGNDAVVSYGENSITLTGVDISVLDQSDFGLFMC